MPKDYIASSRKKHEWLTSEDITIKVDEFAPVVREDTAGKYFVCLRDNIGVRRIVCPYFGPGGADNSLKALRGWVDVQAEEWDFDIIKRDGNIVWLMWKSGTLARTIEGQGKTDGIALHDLLEKLMEEKSNAKV